jgi:hypothetical protein
LVAKWILGTLDFRRDADGRNMGFLGYMEEGDSVRSRGPGTKIKCAVRAIMGKEMMRSASSSKFSMRRPPVRMIHERYSIANLDNEVSLSR